MKHVAQALAIAVGLTMWLTYLMVSAALGAPEHHWGMRRENHC